MIEPWIKLNSSYTYEDQWLKVRRDSYQMPSGHIIDPYHILEFPNWINVVALTNQNEIVLVRQYRPGAQKILTELPSGIIETNEEQPQPLRAAKRELLEETGYKSESFIEVGQYCANPANQANTCYTFFAPNAYFSGTTTPDSTEDLEIVILPFLDYLESTWSGKMPLQGLHAAAIHFTLGYILKSKEDSLNQLKKSIFG